MGETILLLSFEPSIDTIHSLCLPEENLDSCWHWNIPQGREALIGISSLSHYPQLNKHNFITLHLAQIHSKQNTSLVSKISAKPKPEWTA